MHDITHLQNFFAIAYKPPNISSLSFANKLKAGLKSLGIPVKKIGFSGTLDPFAHGMLICGINGCTKLLPHLPKQRKTYRAVLFLGLESKSLDIENVVQIHTTQPFSESQIHHATKPLRGTITYTPPKFSAKHIQGARAYELMRNGVEFEMPTAQMTIFDFQIQNYSHPFLSFEVCVSEGGYVRSIGAMIAKNLGTHGSLCSLERVSEGQWHYRNLLTSCAKDSQIPHRDLPHSYRSLAVPLQLQGWSQNTKVILLDIKNALNYDTIQLAKYAKEAYNGAKLMLDPTLCAKIFDTKGHGKSRAWQEACVQPTQNLQEMPFQSRCEGVCPNTTQQDLASKVVLADFGTHFGIIEVFRNGQVKYIVNRIDTC